jgi:transposase
MVLAGKALEEVRLQLQREGAQLKGAMWSLRGNTWNLSPERQAQPKDLCRQYTQLGRAMSLRQTLQAIYANSDRQLAKAELRWWCGQHAAASGLSAIWPRPFVSIWMASSPTSIPS